MEQNTTINSKQYGQIQARYLNAKSFYTGQSMYVYSLGFVNVMQHTTGKIRRVELIIHCPIKHPEKMKRPDKRTSRHIDAFIGAMLSGKTLYSPTCTSDVLFILR